MNRLTSSDKEILPLFSNEKYWSNVYFKLKEYEELEEKGLLIKLPSTEDVYCVETTIECEYDYSLDRCPMESKCEYCGSEEDNFISCIHQYRTPVIVHRKFNINMLSKLGKSIFTTREEAEKNLEKRLSLYAGRIK